MIWREQGTPCLLCGAAGACKHSEPAPTRRYADPLPDTVNANASRDGLARGTGQGADQSGKGLGAKRYSIPRAAKRDGPRTG